MLGPWARFLLGEWRRTGRVEAELEKRQMAVYEGGTMLVSRMN